MFKYLIGVMLRVRRGQNDEDDAPKGHPLQSLITCFLCGWFITGAYRSGRAVEKRTSEPLLYRLCVPVSVCESDVQQKNGQKRVLFSTDW